MNIVRRRAVRPPGDAPADSVVKATPRARARASDTCNLCTTVTRVACMRVHVRASPARHWMMAVNDESSLAGRFLSHRSVVWPTDGGLAGLLLKRL